MTPAPKLNHRPVDAHQALRRSVVDGAGQRWNIVERDCLGEPGARSARCLIFEQHDAAHRGWHRAWHYPTQWADLSDHQLCMLGRLG